MRKYFWLNWLMVGALVAPTTLLVACGEESSSTISDEKLEEEQEIINTLKGTKRLVANSEILEANNLPFTTEIAQKFGYTNFVPKPEFTYTYSHSSLWSDGTLRINILVGVKDRKARGNIDQVIVVSNLSRFLVDRAANFLKKQTKTLLTYDDFAKRSKPVVDLTDSVIEELALDFESKIPLGAQVSFAKIPNEVKVAYNVRVGTIVESFFVDFTDFSPDGSFQSVLNEQALVNRLVSTKVVKATNFELPITTPQPFTTDIATKFGIENFVPNVNFDYTYSHPGIYLDGILSLLVEVSQDSSTATNAKPISVVFEGINTSSLDIAQTTIRALKSSTLSEVGFSNQVLRGDVFDKYYQTRVGVVLPSTINKVITITAKKDLDSALIEYTLKVGILPPIVFQVEFNVFGTISRSDVDLEQIYINSILTSATYDATPIANQNLTSISAVNNFTDFNLEVASQYGLGKMFRPKIGFVYRYKRDAISKNGSINMTVTVSYGSVNASQSLVIPVAIGVSGMISTEIISTRNILRNGIFSSKLASSFKSIVITSDTTFSQVLTERLGLNLPTINAATTVKMSKAEGSAEIEYKVSQPDYTTQIFKVKLAETYNEIYSASSQLNTQLISEVNFFKTKAQIRNVIVINRSAINTSELQQNSWIYLNLEDPRLATQTFDNGVLAGWGFTDYVPRKLLQYRIKILLSSANDYTPQTQTITNARIEWSIALPSSIQENSVVTRTDVSVRIE